MLKEPHSDQHPSRPSLARSNLPPTKTCPRRCPLSQHLHYDGPSDLHCRLRPSRWDRRRCLGQFLAPDRSHRCRHDSLPYFLPQFIREGPIIEKEIATRKKTYKYFHEEIVEQECEERRPRACCGTAEHSSSGVDGCTDIDRERTVRWEQYKKRRLFLAASGSKHPCHASAGHCLGKPHLRGCEKFDD